MSKPIEVFGVISKIKRVTVEVPVSYFHCGSSRCDKKHQSADTASRCQWGRVPLADYKKASFERGERIVALRDKGMTFKAIGEKVGRWDDPSIPVSGGQISNIHWDHLRLYT